jgi:hypothetical protein
VQCIDELDSVKYQVFETDTLAQERLEHRRVFEAQDSQFEVSKRGQRERGHEMTLEKAREPRIADVGTHWIQMEIKRLQAGERGKNVVERRRSALVMVAQQKNFDVLSNMRM